MTLQMYNYYKSNDPYKGKACMLTGFRCDNKDCTQCVFAKEAYRQAMKEKEQGSRVYDKIRCLMIIPSKRLKEDK